MLTPDYYIEGEIMETKFAYQKLKEIMLQKVELKKSPDDRKKYTFFLNVFNFCLNQLEYEYKSLLIRSFLKCSYKFWWVDIYTKSTFYRMRARALSNFVSLFELIYENIQDF